MISVIITMTLIWLLLCFASVVTLKQYAQKNLELTGATMSHSLEASLVFNDSLAANETLAALGKQGQFAVAEVINAHKKRFAYWSWNPEDNNDTLGALVANLVEAELYVILTDQQGLYDKNPREFSTDSTK